MCRISLRRSQASDRRGETGEHVLEMDLGVTLMLPSFVVAESRLLTASHEAQMGMNIESCH